MVHKTGKTRDILNYMAKNDGITSMEAFKNFGATRLASIIFSLRNQGFDIETIDMECTDRYGHTCRYAKYVLVCIKR